VVYVNPPDMKNDEVSYEEMGDKVFGSDGDPVNARSQFLACSKNQLNYVPACSQPNDKCYGDADFKNSVIKVKINENVAGADSLDVYKWAMRAANRKLKKKELSVNSFTQQMYVYPNEADTGGAAAWAWTSRDTVGFLDTYANRMGLLVHEFSHNIGFEHSVYGSDSYGDHSCLMGNPSWGDDGP